MIIRPIRAEEKSNLRSAMLRNDVEVFANRDVPERVFVEKPLFISDHF